MSHDDQRTDDDHDEFEEELDEEGLDASPGAARRGGEFLAGILLGAAIGAGVALLYAPQEGRRTRADLTRRVRHIKDDAAGRWDDAKHDVQRRIKRRKRRLRKQLRDAAERTRERVPVLD